jgi:hypothetical protein
MISCRVFRSEKDVGELQGKLKDGRYEENELVTLVTSELQNDDLWGEIKYEEWEDIRDIEGNVRKEKAAKSVKFVCVVSKNSSFFVTIGREGEKAVAKVNKIIGNAIAKQFFYPDMIDKFLQQNPHVKKGSGWGDLDIPGLEGASLRGTDVDATPQFSQNYDRHGKKESCRASLTQYGWTIHLSKNGTITFYKNLPEKGMMEFVKKSILPLL